MRVLTKHGTLLFLFHLSGTVGQCSNTCGYALDGDCDDGGPIRVCLLQPRDRLQRLPSVVALPHPAHPLSATATATATAVALSQSSQPHAWHSGTNLL
jgi:hypothetical protein